MSDDFEGDDGIPTEKVAVMMPIEHAFLITGMLRGIGERPDFNILRPASESRDEETSIRRTLLIILLNAFDEALLNYQKSRI